jgi:hypothetical protein
MSSLSGVAVDSHGAFTVRAANNLVAANQTDLALGAESAQAAAVTQYGASRLAAVSAQVQATSLAAASATTPAAERAILTALRSHVAATRDIIVSSQRQATEIAGRVEALQYSTGGHPGVDDTIVGGAGSPAGRIQLVDNKTGPIPLDPAPTPPPPGPVTGDPIKLPSAPPRVPPSVTVIDASPPTDAPHQPGFPKCSTSDNLKHIAEMLAGIALFGSAIPADLASLGLATPGLISGGYMGYDGFDELRKCT